MLQTSPSSSSVIPNVNPSVNPIVMPTIMPKLSEKILKGMSSTGKFLLEFSPRLKVSLIIGIVSKIFSPSFGKPFLVYSLSGLACRCTLILAKQFHVDLFGSYKRQIARLIDWGPFLPLVLSALFFAIYPLSPMLAWPVGIAAGIINEFWHHIDSVRQRQRKQVATDEQQFS